MAAHNGHGTGSATVGNHACRVAPTKGPRYPWEMDTAHPLDAAAKANLEKAAEAIYEVTPLELEKAPAAVRAHLERVPEPLVEVLALDFQAHRQPAAHPRLQRGKLETGLSGP